MLKESLLNSLNQVQEILDFSSSLTDQEKQKIYCEQGVGRHIRHILDHYLVLLGSEQNAVIDYNIRHRESACETCVIEAVKQVTDIRSKISTSKLANKDVLVISETNICETHSAEFSSNFERETLYVINHTIHHTAYISLLFKMNDVTLPAAIGLAPATATYFRKAG